MQPQDVTRVLSDPLAQELMRSSIPARLAYVGPDGFPRAIPIGFHWNGVQFVLCTVPHAPKVSALKANPKVAFTVDTNAFPPHVLLVRGTAAIDMVDGVPPEYLAASRKGVGPDQWDAFEAQVRANEVALNGVRQEALVGSRTTLDVLNAEQELLNSQVLLVTARRDAYVAGFQLLNAMGQAEAQDLGLEGGPLYDPLGNYRRVAGDWNDWTMDRRHTPVSTRTVTPAEQPQGVTPTPR